MAARSGSTGGSVWSVVVLGAVVVKCHLQLPSRARVSNGSRGAGASAPALGTTTAPAIRRRKIARLWREARDNLGIPPR